MKAIRRRRDRPHNSAATTTTTMRRAALLLALLFHGGWSVDTDGCESDADCAVGQWCDTTAQFCPLGQPGIPDPNVTGLLPPPTWLANSTDTGGEVKGCSCTSRPSGTVPRSRRRTQSSPPWRIPSRRRLVYSCPLRRPRSPTGTSRRRRRADSRGRRSRETTTGSGARGLKVENSSK